MNGWQCLAVYREFRTLTLGVFLLAGSAAAQVVQQTASIPDTSSGGTPKPVAMAVNPVTDAVYTVNVDGTLFYIDGSQAIPVASPAAACAVGSASSGTAVAAYTPTNQAFFYVAGDLDAVSGAVGTCPFSTTFSTLAGAHSPLLAVDSSLHKVYAVSASGQSLSQDQLLIVNVGGSTVTANLGNGLTYSSIVADPTSHLVFVSTNTSTIYVIDPTQATPTVVQISGYAGTLFVQPLISPFSSSQLVVAGSTVVNLFSISAIQSAGSSAVPGFSGTYNKAALGTTGSGDTNIALKSPLLDTVNGVLYGALNGIFAGTIPEQTLYSVALSSLPSGANSTTAVGAEVGVLDTFNPGSASAPNIPYALALVPNPSATTHPKIYAVQTGGIPIFIPTDPNGTGIQLFDTSLATPIAATTVPLSMTCPSVGVPTGSTCKLLPSGIVADPTNNNVYVSGNLVYGTSTLTSVADYYVNVVQAPVNSLCATPSTTTPVAGAPTSLTVFYCTSTGTPITSPAYAGTVHFTSTDSRAVLPANYTFQTSDAGSHTFSGVTLKTSGAQTISYADTVTSATKGSTAYTVSAGGAATMVPSAGTPQYALAGTAFGTPLAATVTDVYGNGVPGVVVSFTAPATGASGTFTGTTLVQTGTGGIATAPTLTANSTAGAFSVTASAAGVSPVTFSLTNQAPLPAAVLIPGIISTLHTDAGTAGSIPAASAFDSGGNFYVLDSGLNTITEYPVGGGAAVKIVPQAGQAVTLNTPSDMVMETGGTSLLVSDYANNRLVRVSLGTTVTTTALTLTGVPAASGTCSNPISGTSLCLPTGIAEDLSENIYVSDTSNGRVLKLTNSGAYISTVLAAGSSALMAPLGLAVDPSGNLFIANTTGSSSSGNILKVSPSAAVTTISGGAIVAPFGLATDQAGDVYFTDSSTLESSVITPTSFVYPFAGDGAKTDSGDNGPASLAGIAGPLGFTLDAKANAYIADSVQSAANGGAIREINTSQSALAFGSVTQGVPSTAQSLTLLNAGAASLSIASATVTGPNAADFVLTNHCLATLPSGQTCALSVVFTPSTSAAESATATVTDNSSGSPGATQTIALSGTGTASAVAATPVLSVPTGTYTTIQSVTITDTTAGATIYYTTNGTTPSASSTKYTGSAIPVGVSETLEAIAIATGYQNSAVASANYTINLPTAPTPTFSPVTGSTAAPGSTVTINDTLAGAAITYEINMGPQQFCTAPCSITLSSTIGATETIQAVAVPTGYNPSGVATATYTINLPTAPTPTFSPVTGSTVAPGSTVTVNDALAGAAITYEINMGPQQFCTAPCSIALSNTVGAETIQAVAVPTGYNPSGVATATYTISATPPSFTFLATAANPTATIGGTPTGSVAGTQTSPAATDVTFTLALVSQNGYNTPVNISIAVGDPSQEDEVPTVECVDAGGVPTNVTMSNGGATINCVGSYTPTAGGGTKVWVTFSADGAIPNPAISKPGGSKGISRTASGGLGISLAGLVLGTLARRRRLANAVKMLAMVCMIVSLGVLVGGCELIASVDRSKIPGGSTDTVSSVITATPVGGGTPQSVKVWVTYNVNN